MEKDYVIRYEYTGSISLEAESKSKAIEQAKEILEEQHGNGISDWAIFTIEKVRK